MKTPLATAMALTGALALAPVGLLAQDQQADQQTTATGNESHTWQNPERIADIQDESERIRAFSVLIGQSVYDLMPAAQSSAGTQGNQATQGNQTDGAAQIDQAGSLRGGLPVTIINLATSLDPAEVRSLETLAEENRVELLALQEVIEIDEELRAELEDQGLRPADVVGVQRSGGVLDLYVIPDWLNE